MQYLVEKEGVSFIVSEYDKKRYEKMGYTSKVYIPTIEETVNKKKTKTEGQ